MLLSFGKDDKVAINVRVPALCVCTSVFNSLGPTRFRAVLVPFLFEVSFDFFPLLFKVHQVLAKHSVFPC